MTEPAPQDTLAKLLGRMAVAALVGTITLLALADNPWDGDELFKGPLTGITALGGGDVRRLYDMIRKAV